VFVLGVVPFEGAVLIQVVPKLAGVLPVFSNVGAFYLFSLLAGIPVISPIISVIVSANFFYYS